MKIKLNIISIEQPTYSMYNKDPTEFLVNGMLELIDQFDRLSINMKLAKGRSTKAHNGDKPAGRLPYGYEYSKDKKTVIINEEEKELVTKIFDMCSDGDSYQEIADYLNTNNIKTRNNNDWTKATLHKMINNDFYIGIVTHVEKIQGNHQPIIEKKLWDDIQSKRQYDYSKEVRSHLYMDNPL